MRVVFLQDVEGVALGGEVKEVKGGFARNYLLPKQLAVPATSNALKRVTRLKQDAEATRLKVMADMKALAEELDGTQVNVEMRAGVSGRLYGSVTNAIIATELSKMMDREIDRRTVEVSEAIREVGVFDVGVRLHPEVDATIKVVVYPTGGDPAEVVAKAEEEPEEEEGGVPSDEAAGTTDEGQTADAEPSKPAEESE